MIDLNCDLEMRRRDVRQASERTENTLYGLSYVEAELTSPNNFRTARLTVYFLGRSPEGLSQANVRLEGGRRLPGREIEIKSLERQPASDKGLDDRVVIEVVREKNDLSDYTLRFVALDDKGRQTDQPYPGFDPRYARLTFNFNIDCPSDLDCKQANLCPPQVYAEPDLNYLAKDYTSFRQLILDRLALTLPEWQERHVPDIGIALVELLAYVGDHLSYYQDAVATEAYLDTARQRISVRRHVRLIDYQMHEGCNARALVSINTPDPRVELDPAQIYFITNQNDVLRLNRQMLAEDDLRNVPASKYEVFEPLIELNFELRPGDLVNLPELVTKLRAYNPDPVSKYIWDRLPQALKTQLRRRSPGGLTPKELRWALTAFLNNLMSDSGLYSPTRFILAELPPELQRLVRQNPQGADRLRLNRRLLEQAYPNLIQTSGLIYLYAAHSEIKFYTWGDEACCLPQGATAATLVGSLLYDPIEPAPPSSGEVEADQTSKSTNQAAEETPSNGPDPRPPLTPMLSLQPGDLLIFEEVKGSKTGSPADADLTHRHAVRLTRVEASLDHLYNQPVVEIEWAAEDALPFPLCLSAIGNPPACALLKDISLARGNVVLVDHGRRVTGEDLGAVLSLRPDVSCVGPDQPAEQVILPDRYRPMLAKAPLVFSEPATPGRPVANLLSQEPRRALSAASLTQIPGLPDGSGPLFSPKELEDPTGLADRWFTVKDMSPPPGWFNSLASLLSDETLTLLNEYDGSGVPSPALLNALRQELALLTESWQPARDLLGSGASDRYFVAEIDNEGRAHLRFGEGELGRQPSPGSDFVATYRTGGGLAGNVGARAISHLVTRPGLTLSGVNLIPNNPLPAQGGLAPEPVKEVKLLAPFAFKNEIQRAITAEDYARLARQHPRVQNAAAALRWTGSWYEVLVAIDPYSQTGADETLLAEVTGYLYPFRRMGHDLRVVLSEYVPLDLALTICVKPGYLAGHVKAALLERFSNRRLPGGALGFFHPDNLTFGQSVRLSQIVAAAQAVAGVESVIVERCHRLFEPDASVLEQGILHLEPMEVVRLDNDPNFPENGKLELIMKGGR